MKKLTKFLAILLALLLALGISAAAADLPDDLDSLPVIKAGVVTTGAIAGSEALWYCFSAEKSGFYRFAITGDNISYDIVFAAFDPFSISDQTTENGVIEYCMKDASYCISVWSDDSPADFTILVESVSLLQALQDLLSGLVSEFGTIDFGQAMKTLSDRLRTFISGIDAISTLSTIGMIPPMAIMLGVFFAPFSVGGTLILSLLGVLLLPLTLILSPFMLINAIRG